MSPKLPRITARDLLRALHRDGWYDARQSGSHVILKHPTKEGRAVVPNHPTVVVKPKVLEDVLDTTGLTVQDLEELLSIMKDYRYTIILHPEPEVGGYSVTVPALPGCTTQGETLEEAIVMAKDAIRLYVESLIADGKPVPAELEHPQAIVIDIAA